MQLRKRWEDIDGEKTNKFFQEFMKYAHLLLVVYIGFIIYFEVNFLYSLMKRIWS